jgi:RNA polymerase sigma-70 factor (ECF subfamily)
MRRPVPNALVIPVAAEAGIRARVPFADVSGEFVDVQLVGRSDDVRFRGFLLQAASDFQIAKPRFCSTLEKNNCTISSLPIRSAYDAVGRSHLMHTTSASLLDRLHQPNQPEAWDRFVQLYTPLLYDWARGLGLNDHDVPDLMQEVFAVLLRKLHEFRYDQERSFRGWLRTVLRNKWREIRRKRVPTPMDAGRGPLAVLPDPSDDAQFGEVQYREYLVQRALVLIERDFQPQTWRAWQEFAVAGRPAAEVAGELGISPHAVYLAKARVLRRLREELDGLLDD